MGVKTFHLTHNSFFNSITSFFIKAFFKKNLNKPTYKQQKLSVLVIQNIKRQEMPLQIARIHTVAAV